MSSGTLGSRSSNHATYQPALLGKVNRPGLSNDGDSDLAGILKALFDATGYVLGKLDSRQVIDLVGLDHDPDLATCLDGIGLGDTPKRIGDILKTLDAFQIVVQAFTAGAGPRTRDGVGGLDQDRLQALRFALAMMGLDAVDDIGGTAIALCQVTADRGVRAIHLVVYGLADVV